MFQARHEKVTHRVTLPLPAHEALELFTPETVGQLDRRPINWPAEDR